MEKRFIHLYDDYIHGFINRRSFIDRLTVLAGSTAAATAILPLLENDMARAETVAENDARISAQMIDGRRRPRAQGLSRHAQGAAGKQPAVMVDPREPRPQSAHQGRDPPLRHRGLHGARPRLPRRCSAARPTTRTSRHQDDRASSSPRTCWPSGKAATAYPARAGRTPTARSARSASAGAAARSTTWRCRTPTSTAGVRLLRTPARGRQGGPRSRPRCCCSTPATTSASTPASRPTRRRSRPAGKTYELLRLSKASMHGFNNDTNAARYNKPVADQAWARTTAWFKKYLA